VSRRSTPRLPQVDTRPHGVRKPKGACRIKFAATLRQANECLKIYTRGAMPRKGGDAYFALDMEPGVKTRKVVFMTVGV
jgi:hypothetical protein